LLPIAFREPANYGARGASEFNDVEGAGLYLKTRGDVDPAHVGLWGGSYGGYLTALGLARASNLFAAGADVVQLDDPWMQARPEKAKRYALKAIERALEGVTGTTAIHLCFGYAQMVKDKPSGYSFLPELDRSSARQISIEAAQPRLDLGVLKDLSSKKIMLGVLDLGNPEIETADIIADRIRHGLKYVAADRLIPAPDCGMKYMPRHIAFGKLKAMCDAAAIVRGEIG